jgi:hypothetical protein
MMDHMIHTPHTEHVRPGLRINNLLAIPQCPSLLQTSIFQLLKRLPKLGRVLVECP